MIVCWTGSTWFLLASLSDLGSDVVTHFCSLRCSPISIFRPFRCMTPYATFFRKLTIEWVSCVGEIAWVLQSQPTLYPTNRRNTFYVYRYDSQVFERNRILCNSRIGLFTSNDRPSIFNRFPRPEVGNRAAARYPFTHLIRTTVQPNQPRRAHELKA